MRRAAPGVGRRARTPSRPAGRPASRAGCRAAAAHPSARPAAGPILHRQRRGRSNAAPRRLHPARDFRWHAATPRSGRMSPRQCDRARPRDAPPATASRRPAIPAGRSSPLAPQGQARRPAGARPDGAASPRRPIRPSAGRSSAAPPAAHRPTPAARGRRAPPAVRWPAPPVWPARARRPVLRARNSAEAPPEATHRWSQG